MYKNPSLGSSLLVQGTSRSVYVRDLSAFTAWSDSLPVEVRENIIAGLGLVADRPMADLVLNPPYWKYEAGSNPKVFVVKKGQARLYCCLVGKNVVVLDWDLKKARKADKDVLARAQRLARELSDGRGQSN